MDIPLSMIQITFDDLNRDLRNVYVQTAKESMAEATKSVYDGLASIKANNNCSQNAKVSGEGA